MAQRGGTSLARAGVLLGVASVLSNALGYGLTVLLTRSFGPAEYGALGALLGVGLIGGIPADLIGSLTGLTQGHFPVHAKARYADDISESSAQRRIRSRSSPSSDDSRSRRRRTVRSSIAQRRSRACRYSVASKASAQSTIAE